VNYLGVDAGSGVLILEKNSVDAQNRLHREWSSTIWSWSTGKLRCRTSLDWG
jgi:hypothetical protein